MLNDGPPVEPRPSASVLLARGRDPWRLLMMRRPGGAEFAPSAYVFPGGSAHAEDHDFDDPLRSAAARELFEEVGILLARRRSGRFAAEADCRHLRSALEGGLSWPAGLAECGLTPAFDRLVFLARWITPERLRRRFDTRFFVARRPAGQTVLPQAGEVDELIWVSPEEALAEGGPMMVHATRRILESVAGEGDVGRLLARLRRRRRETPPVRPRIVQADGGGWAVVGDEPRSAQSGP